MRDLCRLPLTPVGCFLWRFWAHYRLTSYRWVHGTRKGCLRNGTVHGSHAVSYTHLLFFLGFHLFQPFILLTTFLFICISRLPFSHFLSISSFNFFLFFIYLKLRLHPHFSYISFYSPCFRLIFASFFFLLLFYLF